MAKSKWTYPAELEISHTAQNVQKKTSFRKYANRVKAAAKKMMELGATNEQVEILIHEVIVELVQES